MLLAWGIGYLQARETYNREQSAPAYQKAARDDAKRSCAGIEPGAVFECIDQKVKTAYQTAHDEQDLTAQQRAASSALATTVLSFFALTISIVGVWYVKRTLDATLEAVKDTGDATAAMKKQNEMVKQAQRPWISIEVEVTQFRVMKFAVDLAYVIHFKNIGQTVAQNVRTFSKTDYFGQYTGEKVAASFGVWRKAEHVEGFALMPGETVDHWGTHGIAIDKIDWQNDDSGNGSCSIVAWAAAYYNTPGESDDRQATERTFRIGIKNENPMKEMIIHKGNLSDLTPATAVAKRTYPSQTS